MDNRQANINRFEAEMAKVTRDGVDKLMAFIRKSDMYAAPASTRFHLSVTGGLLQHSLNVLDALRANLTKNDDGTYSYEVAGVPAARVTEENVIIMALLHDICKTYFYTTEIRNRKVGGKWEQYEAFAVDDKIPYGHGEKSVMMIEEYMKLQPVERYAIRWHMGYTEADTLSFNNAIDRYPMIWALHSADTQASHFMENNEGNKLAYADNGSAEYADQRNTQISRPCRRQPPQYLRRRHQYEHDGTAVPDERASQSQEAAQRKPAVVLYHSFGQMRRAGETLC